MSLSVSIKLDLLRSMLMGHNLKEMVESFSESELLDVHRFIWEKTVEFGIKMYGKRFPQEELQAALRALAELHSARACPAQMKHCQLAFCVNRYPQCMRKIAVEQILAMGAATKKYLQQQNPPI